MAVFTPAVFLNFSMLSRCSFCAFFKDCTDYKHDSWTCQRVRNSSRLRVEQDCHPLLGNPFANVKRNLTWTTTCESASPSLEL